MKFKKVEIQAFRAYDKAPDGTFDFTTSNGEFADFVAIYAPNGFGKTSFYDAVEWGVTKNIHRLVHKKFSFDQAKSEKAENASLKHYVLRNKNSSPDTKSYVRLQTTDPKITGYDLDEPRKGQSDFKFPKSKSDFQKVVLSQEWIDAFLKEDEPSARYQTFVDYFGDIDLDEYYKSVVALQNANDDNIKAILDELNGLQLELQYDGDYEILQTTNHVLLGLKSEGEAVDQLDTRASTSEIVKLRQTIIQRLAEIDAAVAYAVKEIASVETAFVGTEAIIGLSEAEHLRIERRTAEIAANDCKAALERYQRIDISRVELGKIHEAQISLGDRLASLTELMDKFQEYAALEKRIDEVRELRRQAIGSVENARRTHQTNSQQDQEWTYRKSLLSQRCVDLERRIRELPRLRHEWLNHSLATLESDEQALAVKTKILESSADVKKYSGKQIELISLVEALGRDNLPVEIGEHSVYGELIRAISDQQHLLRGIDDLVESNNAKIRDNNALKEDIQSLVSSGLGIVHSRQDATCPLCASVFASTQDLIDRILANEYLSNQLQGLLTTQNDLATQRDNQNETIHSLKQYLLSSISGDIENNGVRLNESLLELHKLARDQRKISETHQKLEKQAIELSATCVSSEINSEERRLIDELARTQQEIDELTGNISANADKLLTSNTALESSLKLQDSLSAELESLRSSPIHKMMVSYFTKNFPNASISADTITNQRKKSESDLRALADQNINTSNLIAQLELEFKNQTSDSLTNDLNVILRSLEDQSRKLASFEQSIVSSFRIDELVSEVDLRSFLNDHRGRLQAENARHSKMIVQYNLLRELLEDVEPYLKYDTAKARHRDGHERLAHLRDVVQPLLESERKKVTDHLNNMVNSFFYEDVINALYRKIDPHPDYKSIKFKCDFSDDKPALNVFVIDEGENTSLIPNLYFSTAQLNILSLSIFLAKALNATDEDGVPFDCVFIDDPIQSMDSINVLSTIDLLRSIVYNHKKQIILSTHDENFFALLQKKLPDTIFKAKYIELETFGKVKA